MRKYDYSSPRNLVYASAPMSVDKLVEAIEVFGPVLTQIYGRLQEPVGKVPRKSLRETCWAGRDRKL